MRYSRKENEIINNVIAQHKEKSYFELQEILANFGFKVSYDAIRKRIKSGGVEITLSHIEKRIKERVLPAEDVPTPKGNVLLIGDPHFPFVHPDYLDFLLRVRDEHDCTVIRCTGDLVDNHYSSYHETDPDGYSAGTELDLTIKKLKDYVREFPTMYITKGNHDKIPDRKAQTAGISSAWVRDYNEVLELPDTWYWSESFKQDGVMYLHGTGKGGQNGAINWAKDQRMSCAIGHIHSFGGCTYTASDRDLIFGLNAGCGIDIKSYAMAYGANFGKRPTLGCGVIKKEGREGMFIPMPL